MQKIIKTLQIISGVFEETASFGKRKLFQFLESLQGCFKLFKKNKSTYLISLFIAVQQISNFVKYYMFLSLLQPPCLFFETM